MIMNDSREFFEKVMKDAIVNTGGSVNEDGEATIDVLFKGHMDLLQDVAGTVAVVTEAFDEMTLEERLDVFNHIMFCIASGYVEYEDLKNIVKELARFIAMKYGYELKGDKEKEATNE